MTSIFNEGRYSGETTISRDYAQNNGKFAFR